MMDWYARASQSVAMRKNDDVGVANDASDLTPNPFPWWKGNQI